MRKGVAIGYVIALILGVAVIALIGIWLVMSGGKFTKAGIETDCRAEILKQCGNAITAGADPTTVQQTAMNAKCTGTGITVPTTLVLCSNFISG